MKRLGSWLLVAAVAALGALSYTVVALHRGEPLNAAWILTAALCTYALGYRLYSKWIAAQLLTLDDRRATPCEVHEDGRDFVRTNRWIVFGHHFAAISGPGPLVGPVLAAQFGYLPSTLWLLVGVVLAGAVQDFIILVASMRRDGKSLGEMVKDEIGTAAGIVSLIAIVCILVILIAVLGLVVVKALAHSPWGTFTIAATLPIALFMGIYLRYLRPGRVLEVSAIGVVLLLLSVWFGRYFHEIPSLSGWLTFEGTTLAWAIIVYGLCASILPVWLLLAPRDYLSTFLKLGTIAALVVGILIVLPPLRMPALTRFVDGTGPVFSGNVFPFCFVTVACGAISGFHSLIASGTTPKLITRESHARSIGYGSMLLESTVAIMALVAACTLDPGVYFAMNSPAAIVGNQVDKAADVISSWGFPVTAAGMIELARDLGESTLLGRAGGAPTLAVGMAKVFSSIIGGKALMALWYHFAIMFEALFILTTVDAGTRVGRFLVQALFTHARSSLVLLTVLPRPLRVLVPVPRLGSTLGDTRSWTGNVLASVLLVGGWGYFLYQGVIDPLGGINSLWPLFGIANQLLAVIALCLATTVLLKMGKRHSCIATVLPLAWVTAVTFAASYQKILSPDPKIGFLSAAQGFGAQIDSGSTPAARIAELVRTQFNLRVDAVVASLFLLLVGAILLLSIWQWLNILMGHRASELKESPIVWLSPQQLLTNPSHHVERSIQGAALFTLGLARQVVGEPNNGHFHDHCDHAEKSAVKDRRPPGLAWVERVTRRSNQPRCC